MYRLEASLSVLGYWCILLFIYLFIYFILFYLFIYFYFLFFIFTQDSLFRAYYCAVINEGPAIEVLIIFKAPI